MKTEAKKMVCACLCVCSRECLCEALLPFRIRDFKSLSLELCDTEFSSGFVALDKMCMFGFGRAE